MMTDIRLALKALILQAKWMDEKTRKYALHKLRAMGQLIAYPDFFVDPDYVEEKYRGVSTIRVVFKAFCNKNRNNNNKLYDIHGIHVLV